MPLEPSFWAEFPSSAGDWFLNYDWKCDTCAQGHIALYCVWISCTKRQHLDFQLVLCYDIIFIVIIIITIIVFSKTHTFLPSMFNILDSVTRLLVLMMKLSKCLFFFFFWSSDLLIFHFLWPAEKSHFLHVNNFIHMCILN